MQISGAGQNVVRDSGGWKSVRKGIALAGKAVAGAVAGAVIDGVGGPLVYIKEVGKSMGRDIHNLVTIKDVPESLFKLAADTIVLPLGTACYAVLGTIGGAVIGAVMSCDSLKEGTDICKGLVEEQNQIFENINSKRDLFPIFEPPMF